MSGAVRAAAQREMHAPLEQAIQNRLRQIAIMHHVAQGRQRFVRGEQDRPALEVAFVDDAIEDIRRIGGVREIPQLVDDQDMGMEVRRQRRGEARFRKPRARARRSIRPRRRSGLRSHAESRGTRSRSRDAIPGAAGPTEDRVPSLAHELGAQITAEHLELERGLKREVEVVFSCAETGSAPKRTARLRRVSARCAISSAMSVSR